MDIPFFNWIGQAAVTRPPHQCFFSTETPEYQPLLPRSSWLAEMDKRSMHGLFEARLSVQFWLSCHCSWYSFPFCLSSFDWAVIDSQDHDKNLARDNPGQVKLSLQYNKKKNYSKCVWEKILFKIYLGWQDSRCNSSQATMHTQLKPTSSGI